MDFKLPELGEGVYEGELTDWLVKPGQVVRRGQNLMEVMTDKATMEIPAPFAGTISALQAEPGQTLKVGDVVLTYAPIDQTETPATGGRATTKPAASAPRPRATGDGARDIKGPPAKTGASLAAVPESVRASPSVRYMARKLGVDLAQLAGSGPLGRVLAEDLATHVKATAGEATAAPPEPWLDFGKPGTRVKLIGLRRKSAQHLIEAKRIIPHYTYVDECDVTDMVRLRESLKETFARSGTKLTYLAFLVKAAAFALKEVPLVNASLDDAAGELVLHDHYHIGIAVATPNGLIVPVVRDADRKDLAAIAREVEQLSAVARSGKVQREHLRGGTFTITSVGGIGGLISTPVVNHPEVAILGIGKVVKRPVYDAVGNVCPADVLYLSLSCDHRVVDGAVAAVFCNAVIRRLRNPAALLLPEPLG